MKELKITITFPEGFGNVAVNTVIKQSGEGEGDQAETVSSTMEILKPTSKDGESLPSSSIEISYEEEKLISASFKTPEVKTST